MPLHKVRVNEAMIGFDTDTSIVENNELSDVQIKILELMRGKPKISAKVISQEIGIAARNVQSHIKVLKIRGLVERIGAAKSGQWVVK